MKNNKRNITILAAFCSIMALPAITNAADTGDITIEGTVEAVYQLDIEKENGVYNDINLNEAGTGIKIAEVTEKSNNQNGYKVTISSANANGSGAPYFKSSTLGNNDTIDYDVIYDSTTLTFTDGSSDINENGPTDGNGRTKDLKISFSKKWVKADDYSDTITLTIAAKD